MVKLAFYKGLSAPNRNWQDKLICLWTKGQYSHVELIVYDYMYSSSPTSGKVRKEPHTIDNDVWEYVSIDNVNTDNILEFFELTKGKKYDWLGILGFIIPLKDRTDKWFCSEWVSNALKISGYKNLWIQEPSKISPNKLYKIVKG